MYISRSCLVVSHHTRLVRPLHTVIPWNHSFIGRPQSCMPLSSLLSSWLLPPWSQQPRTKTDLVQARTASKASASPPNLAPAPAARTSATSAPVSPMTSGAAPNLPAKRLPRKVTADSRTSAGVERLLLRVSALDPIPSSAACRSRRQRRRRRNRQPHQRPSRL